MKLVLFVGGDPIAQGSMRPYAARTKAGVYTGKVGMAADSSRLDNWRSAVQTAAAAAIRVDPDYPLAPLGGPLHIQIEFRMPRPQRHFIAGNILRGLRPDAPVWPIDGVASRDIDKLVRAIFDGIKAGGAVIDDRNFTQLETMRVYAEPGELAGAHIEIMPCLARPPRFTLTQIGAHQW